MAGKPKICLYRPIYNQTKSELVNKRQLLFLYILGVQNLKHSEATFALFLPRSHLVRPILTCGSLFIVATRCDATSLH